MKNDKIPKCQLWDSKVSNWHFGNRDKENIELTENSYDKHSKA